MAPNGQLMKVSTDTSGVTLSAILVLPSGYKHVAALHFYPTPTENFTPLNLDVRLIGLKCSEEDREVKARRQVTAQKTKRLQESK